MLLRLQLREFYLTGPRSPSPHDHLSEQGPERERERESPKSSEVQPTAVLAPAASRRHPPPQPTPPLVHCLDCTAAPTWPAPAPPTDRP